MRNLYLLLALCLGLSFTAQAQDSPEDEKSSLEMKLQIRPRAEYRDGVLGLLPKDADPAFFINNRARLSIYFTDKSGRLKLGLSGQNVGVYGATPQIESQGTVMFNEAWAEIKASEVVSFRIGRQMVSYDDQRILGGLDWQVSGRWHDLLLTKFDLNTFKAHIGLAYSQNSEKKFDPVFLPGGQPYKTMQYLWFENAFTENLKLSVLAINLGYQKLDANNAADGINYEQTLGANIDYKIGAFSIYGTYYHQLGDNGASREVDAFLAALKIGFKPEGSAFNFAVGADLVSGNDAVVDNNGSVTFDGNGKNNAFDPLYGTHHKFYGLMDYFYVGNHLGNVGLFDKYLQVNWKANSRLGFGLGGHVFHAAADIKDGNGGDLNKYLGTEVDLTFKYAVMKYVTLMGGYSQMIADDSMEYLYPKGDSSDVQNWGWLSININPVIFKGKF